MLCYDLKIPYPESCKRHVWLCLPPCVKSCRLNHMVWNFLSAIENSHKPEYPFNLGDFSESLCPALFVSVPFKPLRQINSQGFELPLSCILGISLSLSQSSGASWYAEVKSRNQTFKLKRKSPFTLTSWERGSSGNFWITLKVTIFHFKCFC